uniref:Uncharacterized protein n=1 Tax=Romanomermis culicivorax TaxID=13658 RepID=A0A915KPQ3_ROMCU
MILKIADLFFKIGDGRQLNIWNQRQSAIVRDFASELGFKTHFLKSSTFAEDKEIRMKIRIFLRVSS